MRFSVDRLATVPLFNGLTAADLDDIGRRIQVQAYEDGQWVVAHGDDDRDVFIVLDGRLRVILFGETRELILEDLAAGALVGEMSAIDDQPRSASVIALDAVEVARLSAANFLDLVHIHPSICDYVLRVLVQRVRSLDRRVHELASMTVSQRVRAELLRLVSPIPGKPRQGELAGDLTHAELAARIGTHREAVTREIGSLIRSGYLRKEEGRLVVSDVRTLSSSLAEI